MRGAGTQQGCCGRQAGIGCPCFGRLLPMGVCRCPPLNRPPSAKAALPRRCKRAGSGPAASPARAGTPGAPRPGCRAAGTVQHSKIGLCFAMAWRKPRKTGWQAGGPAAEVTGGVGWGGWVEGLGGQAPPQPCLPAAPPANRSMHVVGANQLPGHPPAGDGLPDLHESRAQLGEQAAQLGGPRVCQRLRAGAAVGQPALHQPASERRADLQRAGDHGHRPRLQGRAGRMGEVGKCPAGSSERAGETSRGGQQTGSGAVLVVMEPTHLPVVMEPTHLPVFGIGSRRVHRKGKLLLGRRLGPGSGSAAAGAAVAAGAASPGVAGSSNRHQSPQVGTDSPGWSGAQERTRAQRRDRRACRPARISGDQWLRRMRQRCGLEHGSAQMAKNQPTQHSNAPFILRRTV